MKDHENNIQIAEDQTPLQLNESDQVDTQSDTEVIDPDTQSLESCQEQSSKDKVAEDAGQESSVVGPHPDYTRYLGTS